jgi:putative transposase
MKSKRVSNRKKMSGKVTGIYIIFFTKYNRPLLKGPIQKRTIEIVNDVLEDLGCQLNKIWIYPNRVHLQFEYPPRLAISEIMNRIKGKSSRILRREFPELTKKCKKALWAPRFGMYY